MLLSEVVTTSAQVGATSKRSEKTAILADLFQRLEPDEVAPVVGWLVGWPRQGKVGIGWAQLRDLAGRSAGDPLVIADFDHLIDEIAETTGSGSVAARASRLQAVLDRASADEATFIKNVLIGELRQGTLAGLVMDGIAKASGTPAKVVRRAVMLAGDLPEIAELAMTSDRATLEAVGLTVGRAIQPMLAATSESIAAGIDDIDGRCSIEWKLDGARIQAHRTGEDVRLFTRNLNDVTNRLPGVVAVVRGFECNSVVLDGEVLALAAEDRPEAFQDVMAAFGSDAPSGHLRPWFFDIMHLDGTDLIDAPLSERHDALDALVGDHAVPRILTTDPIVGDDFFQRTVAAGHEGVMVKDASSRYEAGRRGKGWRKVKPVITLDLVVIAVEWGHGRRQGWLSNLHLGARSATGFVMVGKTFKGMTDEMLKWQTEHFQAIAERTDGHVVHVRPETVVEIAIDGVQTSTRYPGGSALRFARVKQYRPDKTPAHADTIETVQSLRRS